MFVLFTTKILYYIIFLLSYILPVKTFYFGEGYVSRYTLFEIRNLCSIYFHNINTKKQDRYHTHAFNAYSFIINGEYSEIIFETKQILTFKSGIIRYIPRNLNHKLCDSKPNTWSILICGPYNNIWTEHTENEIIYLTKHRKILKIEKFIS